jgi:hypothetical protein
VIDSKQDRMSRAVDAGRSRFPMASLAEVGRLVQPAAARYQPTA